MKGRKEQAEESSAKSLRTRSKSWAGIKPYIKAKLNGLKSEDTEERKKITEASPKITKIIKPAKINNLKSLIKILNTNKKKRPRPKYKKIKKIQSK